MPGGSFGDLSYEYVADIDFQEDGGAYGAGSRPSGN
jgi:hypothetical protein